MTKTPGDLMPQQSILATDGYKFAMAAAGFPLRKETFYYSHRRGGPHYLPFDVEALVRELLPTKMPTDLERQFLVDNGYDMGGAFWEAMKGEIVIKAIPKGTWFFDREPVFTVTGPSALVSWLEPLVLQLHYRIQIATLAKLGKLPPTLTVTCGEQLDQVLDITNAVGMDPPEITVDRKGYHEHVKGRVAELIQIVGDPARIFEVGMRAANCMEQHQFALEAAKEAGLKATSNVELAFEMDLKAVGTMGHEHVQRFGSDASAFRAMRDRQPGATSFLLDTFSTIYSGLPTAFDLIAEEPSRRDTVRFDSGDKETQFLIACSMARNRGINPRFILEDGFTAEMTRTFEALRLTQNLPPEDVLYGFGGYIVKAPGDPLTRDRVAAVWKVTQSGPNATMKFGDEAGSGKESIPGKPVLFRVYNQGWSGLVAQEGEFDDHINGEIEHISLYHPDYAGSRRLQFAPVEALAFARKQGNRPAYSPQTQALVADLTAARQRALKGA
jgi:nicotinate phosphoribosyltransferase